MKFISVNELYPKWLLGKEKNKPVCVIDVREVGEYQQGHIPNAKLIVLKTVPSCSDEFPTDGEVFVVCKSGMRSSQAIEFLEQTHGHQNLINVTGGTMAWLDASYPIELGA